jgi:UbiD family decarboxylase
VKAVTPDLLVPAQAEMIIEGEVLPGRCATEGPFGESAGYMSEAAPKPVARITAITHRRDAICYGLASQMPPSESTTLQSLSNAALIRKQLRHDWGEPGVRDVWIDLMFGGGAAHGIVSLRVEGPGHARRVGRLLAARTPLKRITIVDEDIDVRDRTDLDWVMSSHVDPARDTEVIGGFPASMDHAVTPDAAGRKIGSKLVIDATRSLDTGPFSLPLPELMVQARQTWEGAGLPELPADNRVRKRLGI